MSDEDKPIKTVNVKNMDLKKTKYSLSTLHITIIILSLCCISLFIFIGVYAHKQDIEKLNDQNLVGYTLQKEELVDSCNLIAVDGFYLGKGVLNGEVHYIFQAEKNGQKSSNVDVIEKFLEIHYVDVTADTNNSNTDLKEKPGTVEAFARTYTKPNKDGKSFKKESRYFYKIYIPKDNIKDCGQLTTDPDNSEDE